MAKSAIAWRAKRMIRKPFSRLLDRRQLKKANQTALDERVSRAERADFMESELNRIAQTKEPYNPEELQRIARAINRYAHSTRAARDRAIMQSQSKRAALDSAYKENRIQRAIVLSAEMKRLRRHIIRARQESGKAQKRLEELEQKKRKKMAFTD